MRRTVAWDPDTGILTVGARSIVLTCAAGDNECVLRTYLNLVAEQRAVPLDGSIVLRRDDITVLAEVLDLDDDHLEATLARLLHISAPEASALRRRLLRQRVAVATVGFGLVAGLPVARGLAGADEAPTFIRVDAVEAPATTDPAPAPALTKVLTVLAAPPTSVAADPSPPTESEPPETTPTTEPPVEIGYAVTYERDPNYVPPEGVEIGDAMVIERDLPPGSTPEG